jgi:hypothetical protein
MNTYANVSLADAYMGYVEGGQAFVCDGDSQSVSVGDEEEETECLL